MDAEIVVVNIINSRDVQAVSTITSMGYEVDGNNFVNSIKGERLVKLNGFIKESALPPEKTQIIFRVGNPSVALLKIAVEEDVDLIVMGIKAEPDWDIFLLVRWLKSYSAVRPQQFFFYRDEKQNKRLKQRISLK